MTFADATWRSSGIIRRRGAPRVVRGVCAERRRDAEFNPLTRLMKVMFDYKMGKRKVSSSMADPCVLTTSEYGWSANTERPVTYSQAVLASEPQVREDHAD